MKLNHWLLAIFVAALSVSAWALPSVQDVESAVKQGQYAQAESMMKEVVDAKPDSAKGHYLYAEILARNGRYTQATEEARAAERLDPAVHFTQPEKFRAFQQLLAREQSARTAPARTAQIPSTQTAAPADSVAPVVIDSEPAARTAATRSSGIPGWVWLAGLLALGFMLFRGFARSRAASGGMGQPGYGAPGGYGPSGSTGPAGYGANTGYPQGGMPYGAQAPGRQGPGWVGTGLAAAGGVAAGMMLDRALHQNDGNIGHQASAGDPGSLSDLSRMSTFGNGSNDAERELQQRDVDFGSGNDWGGDASSFDSGSSSSSDDWT
jgi:hypothetical protein